MGRLLMSHQGEGNNARFASSSRSVLNSTQKASDGMSEA
ncbi:hypothetical protein VCR17J2_90141 [Vibrio coralliirubri]|nr:hypothetical protein VCR17J2_90141 [Vibrio coralliirubri]